MQVEGLPKDLKESTLRRISVLLGEREQATKGDVTAGVDKKSGRYTKRETTRKRGRTRTRDPVQQAIEDVT